MYEPELQMPDDHAISGRSFPPSIGELMVSIGEVAEANTAIRLRLHELEAKEQATATLDRLQNACDRIKDLERRLELFLAKFFSRGVPLGLEEQAPTPE